MKKLTALLIMTVFVLLSVNVFAATPAELLGTWYTGERQGASDTYLLTGDYHVEFNRDSTAKLVMNGIEKEGTWTAEDDGAKLEFANAVEYIKFYLENNQLKVYMEDFSVESGGSDDFVFSREQPELFKVPEVTAAEKEDSYFGDWKMAFSVTPKGVLPAGAEEDDISYKIEFAQISKTDSYVKYALTNFVDGKLVFNAEDLGLGTGTAVVELTDNDYIRLTIEGVAEEEFCKYLTKADAATEAVPEEEVPEGEAPEGE